MDIEVIKKNIKVIEDCNRRLYAINDVDEKLNIELRVFTKGSWSNIDFKPENEAITNMVIHQIKMDLESKIKKAKKLIEKETKID